MIDEKSIKGKTKSITKVHKKRYPLGRGVSFSLLKRNPFNKHISIKMIGGRDESGGFQLLV